MLLIALMVLPISSVGLIGYHALFNERAHEGTTATPTDVSVGVSYSLNQHACGLEQMLTSSLADLMTKALTVASTSHVHGQVLDGEPTNVLEPYVFIGDERGVISPAVSEELSEGLEPLIRTRRPRLGLVVLPEPSRSASLSATPQASDSAMKGVLCQIAVLPIGTDRTVIAIRDLTRAGDALLSAQPLGERVVRSIIGTNGSPLAMAFGSLSECRRLWQGVMAEVQDPPSNSGGTKPTLSADEVSAAMLEARRGQCHQFARGNVLFGVRPLVDIFGNVVALAAIIATERDLEHVPGSDAALPSQVLALVGWIAVIGVLTAVLIGMLAPRWVWRDIRESTDGIFRSVERLRELVRRNSRALDEHSRVLQRLSNAVTTLDSDSKSIANTTKALAQNAEQSAWVSRNGNQKAETAQRSVQAMRDRAEALVRQTEELERRCAAIGGLLSVIDHLSNETNTLSMNATIQAAAAGASGRQFSAVASEIRKLADMALDSTKDIQLVIEQIQSSSRMTLSATQDGCKEVDRCLNAFQDLERAFARILLWVEETTQSAQGIETSTARQSESLESVSQSLEALEQRARETSGNFHDVVDAADELAELGSRMNETWRVG
ncbi:MAG: methyl-accepting chemotaxis protein [Planctomycetota bacterium]